MPAIPNLEPDPQLPQYRFNAAAGRYIDSRGHFVGQATIRGELDKVLDNVTADMVNASKAFRAGTIDGATFQAQTMALIKEGHLAGAAMQKGGWAQLSQSDFGRVGQIVRREYEFHRGMLDDILSGKQRLDGTLDVRLRLYGQAARGTYHQFEREARNEQGYDEERRIRYAADSCDTCVEQEDLEWQPIGTLNRIGDSECRNFCACLFIYRRSDTGETV